MAVKQPWESIYGVSLKDAYHRITGVSFDYDNNTVTLRVAIYADELSRETGKPPMYVRKVTLDVDEGLLPIREPLYEYLKTTTNYAEAEDV